MSDTNWQQKNRELSALDQVKADAERRFSIGARDGQSCKACKFWLNKKNESLGSCIRHAPSYGEQYFYAESPSAHDMSNKRFPATFPDDWCGDFEPKR
jgi:hypothetical protein